MAVIIDAGGKTKFPKTFTFTDCMLLTAAMIDLPARKLVHQLLDNGLGLKRYCHLSLFSLSLLLKCAKHYFCGIEFSNS
jgi:hypothetical protein